MATISSAVYIAIFACYVTALVWDLTYIASSRPSMGHLSGISARFVFLTFWDLWFQVIHHGVIVAGIIINLVTNRPMNLSKPSLIRTYLSRAVAGPYGLFVAVSFWLLYAIDRELVYPKALDAFIPQWWNHCAHTLPLVSVIFDRFVSDYASHRQTRPMLPVTLTLVIGLSYLVWILYLGLVRQLWVYPVLNVLSAGGRMVFIIASSAILIASFLACDIMASFLWRNSKRSGQRKMKTK